MSSTESPAQFGRVEVDGTVYVRTNDGERRVGQVPGVSPDEAMAFYVRRFTALETEVGLLTQRVNSGSVGPDEARKIIAQLTKTTAEANAVGDLQGLTVRLEALQPKLAEATEARKAERAAVQEQTRLAKQAMVAEAEKLAESDDWRGGVNRFRILLERWKALPRIDRATDDELWHSFSAARTVYTRRRKTQFAEQSQMRDAARVAKEKIIAQASELVDSTDWGAAAGQFRDLMTRWKAAGSAPREVDEKLWTQFRGLQDQFFARRSAALSEQDAEFRGNQAAKEALLDEAEKTIVPVKDLAAARGAFRDFLEKFNSYGKVPRDAVRPLDSRVRALEKAVQQAEEAEWRRTDPAARQRAQDTVDMFSAQIAKLTRQADQAEAQGNDKKAAQLRDSITTYQSWLDQAARTLADFTS